MANSAEAEKTGSGELRTEIDPLTKRFSVLGDSFEAKWMSGEFGDPRNPGPSTYWIDAVITLEEQQVAKLKSAYAPQPTDKSPSVVEGMRAHLPSGPYLASESLDDAFAEGGWWATAYLDEQSGDLVLEAMKGN